jgi:hypothetical protein
LHAALEQVNFIFYDITRLHCIDFRCLSENLRVLTSLRFWGAIIWSMFIMAGASLIDVLIRAMQVRDFSKSFGKGLKVGNGLAPVCTFKLTGKVDDASRLRFREQRTVH